MGGVLLGQNPGPASSQDGVWLSIAGPGHVNIGEPAQVEAEVTGADSWVWILPTGRHVTDEDQVQLTPTAPGSSTDSTLNHEDAVDTITYPIASSSGIEGEISMGVRSWEVTDQGMLLTMSFVPDDDDSDGPVRFFDGLYIAGNIDSYLLPAVNDRRNMKAYYVPDAEGEHLSGWTYFRTESWASSMDIHVRSGETAVLWAYYPVPEDKVDTVEVAVMPGVQDFRDVQINWGDYEPGDYGNAAEVDGDECETRNPPSPVGECGTVLGSAADGHRRRCVRR